ncbi:AAHS family 4-hydroxybenzoate transporter-like MFS transporter [Sphingomonas sp. UYAg733]
MDAAPLGWLQWAVAVMVTAILFLDGLDYQIAAFAAPALMAEWSLTKPEFAPLLAAAMIGMAIGTLIGSWAGDRYGRRTVLVASVAFFGAMTLACAAVTGPKMFLAVRLIGGLGLGSAFPLAMAMMSEWMPRRVAGKAISIMTIGIPAGIIVGAMAAGWLLPQFGWRTFFAGTGLLTVAASAILLWKLPESPAYLILKDRQAQAHALLHANWGAPVGDGVEGFQLETRVAGDGRLMTGDNARVNVGLWLSGVSVNVATYGIAGWLTVILVGFQLPLQSAVRGQMIYSFAAIGGTLCLGWFIARWGSRVVMLALALGASTVAIAMSLAIHMLPVGTDLFRLIFIGLAVAGFCIGGVMAGNFVVAAQAYPTPIRARGIGLVAAVSRIGAILSSFAGGAALALGQGGAFFAMVAVLVLTAAVGVEIIDRHLPRRALVAIPKQTAATFNA